jgi:hypothetical protein
MGWCYSIPSMGYFLSIIISSPASSSSFVIITIMHPTHVLLSCQLETPSYIGSGFFFSHEGN